jgi:hypothetical protein
MATDFPTSLDTLLNPTASDPLDNDTPGLKHATQHDNANDAIEAIEAKVGIDGSAVATSLDYKSRNGSFIRKTENVATDSLASAATDNTKVLSIGKGCLLVKLETDYPAWVRIYSSQAAQTADASRARTTDPTAGAGVLLEVITVAGALAVGLSPAIAAYSLEASPGTTLYITVTNDDTVSRVITVTVTVIPIEG